MPTYKVYKYSSSGKITINVNKELLNDIILEYNDYIKNAIKLSSKLYRYFIVRVSNIDELVKKFGIAKNYCLEVRL